MGKKVKKKYQKPKPKPQTDIHVGIVTRTPYGALIDIETIEGFKGRMWIVTQNEDHIQSLGRTIFNDHFPKDVWR